MWRMLNMNDFYNVEVTLNVSTYCVVMFKNLNNESRVTVFTTKTLATAVKHAETTRKVIEVATGCKVGLAITCSRPVEM